MEEVILLVAGFITGLIDSVVGGGGLISLPTISLYLGPGVESIATNKVLGSIGASVSLAVYAFKGHLPLKKGLIFCLLAAGGSYLGSNTSKYIDPYFFKILLLIICPFVLYIVLKKDNIFKNKPEYNLHPIFFFITGVVAGFYDGFFGPGGGTMMFLGIYFFSPYNLLNSIAISKLANTFSATTALVNFGTQGLVNWEVGLMMGITMALGAFFGANLAVKNLDKLIRPILILVVSILIIRLIFFT